MTMFLTVLGIQLVSGLLVFNFSVRVSRYFAERRMKEVEEILERVLGSHMAAILEHERQLHHLEQAINQDDKEGQPHGPSQTS